MLLFNLKNTSFFFGVNSVGGRKLWFETAYVRYDKESYYTISYH